MFDPKRDIPARRRRLRVLIEQKEKAAAASMLRGVSGADAPAGKGAAERPVSALDVATEERLSPGSDEPFFDVFSRESSAPLHPEVRTASTKLDSLQVVST